LNFLQRKKILYKREGKKLEEKKPGISKRGLKRGWGKCSSRSLRGKEDLERKGGSTSKNVLRTVEGVRGKGKT